jgi:hypothetical protein
VTTFAFRLFLDVAEDLASRDDEAYRRSALGRAYHAIFGAARRALPPSLQLHMGQGRVHTLTWNQYAGSSTQTSRQIGGIGFRLRRMRERADYDASATFAATRVRDALNEAQLALALLDRHGYQP